MSTITKLAAAWFALSAATAASGANAMPSPPVAIDAGSEDAGVTIASGRFCYPRLVWTYRPGFGRRLIAIGKICIPTLRMPIPRPGPGPDPGPLQRIPRGVGY